MNSVRKNDSGLPADLQAAKPDAAAALTDMFDVYRGAAAGQLSAVAAAELIAKIAADVQEMLEDYRALVEQYFAALINAVFELPSERPTTRGLM